MLRHLTLTSSRNYSGAALKRYNGFTNWPSLTWNTRVPAPAKIFGMILSAAVTMTHVHPSTLVTLGPPMAVGSYFLNRRINHQRFLRLLALVKPSIASEWDDVRSKIRIWNYDETNVQNVLRGIDNEFQHTLVQSLEVLLKKLIDYVVQQESEDAVSPLVALLLDENKQVVMHLGESPETLVSTRAEVIDQDGNEQFVKFVRFSVALYSSKSIQTRSRVGVVDVGLLGVPEHEGDDDLEYQDYRMGIEITPFKLFAKPEIVSAVGTQISSAGGFERKKE